MIRLSIAIAGRERRSRCFRSRRSALRSPAADRRRRSSLPRHTTIASAPAAARCALMRALRAPRRRIRRSRGARVDSRSVRPVSSATPARRKLGCRVAEREFGMGAQRTASTIASFSSGSTLQVAYTSRPPGLTSVAAAARIARLLRSPARGSLSAACRHFRSGLRRSVPKPLHGASTQHAVDLAGEPLDVRCRARSRSASAARSTVPSARSRGLRFGPAARGETSNA